MSPIPWARSTTPPSDKLAWLAVIYALAADLVGVAALGMMPDATPPNGYTSSVPTMSTQSLTIGMSIGRAAFGVMSILLLVGFVCWIRAFRRQGGIRGLVAAGIILGIIGAIVAVGIFSALSYYATFTPMLP